MDRRPLKAKSDSLSALSPGLLRRRRPLDKKITSAMSGASLTINASSRRERETRRKRVDTRKEIGEGLCWKFEFHEGINFPPSRGFPFSRFSFFNLFSFLPSFFLSFSFLSVRRSKLELLDRMGGIRFE